MSAFEKENYLVNNSFNDDSGYLEMDLSNVSIATDRSSGQFDSPGGVEGDNEVSRLNFFAPVLYLPFRLQD